jgi:hypothetical protein
MREQESMKVEVKPTFKCHRSGLVFDRMIDVYEHRMKEYPLDYVHGVPFQFLEVKLDEKEMASLPVDWDDPVEGCQHYGTSEDSCYDCDRCEIIAEIELESRDDL